MDISIKKLSGKQVLCRFITALGVLFLCFFFEIYAKTFNGITWKMDAEDYHLGKRSQNTVLWEIYDKITDIKSEINFYIKHDPKYDAYFEEICKNPVGFTTLKIMIAKMKYGNVCPITVIENRNRCGFSSKKRCIFMTEAYFDKNDIGIINFCSLDEHRKVIPIKFSKVEALFHELCHAFHYISKTRKEDIRDLKKIYKNDRRGIFLWTDKDKVKSEELFTIVGFNEGNYDPINANIFDANNSIINGFSIQQRIFHISYSDNLKDEVPEAVLKRTIPLLNPMWKYFY